MLILLLAGVMIAWYLQFIIYRKQWDRGLTVDVRFEDSYVYEGDVSHLREEISNNKLLPLPALEVRLSMDRNLIFSGEAGKNASVSDKNYQRDVFAFFGRQKVIRRIPFACSKRGFYQITQSEVVGYDLLYSHEYYQERPQQTQMYVYPAPVDISRIRLVCQTISGMVIAQRRLYPDPFEFSGIREYQVTDPMNHINWKASARSGSLMVNQHDSTTSISVSLVLDVSDPGIWKNEELVEESIRITSSLAAELVGKGMELDLISNAHVDWKSVAEGGRNTVKSETGSTYGDTTENSSGNKQVCAEPDVLRMHMKSGAGLLQEMYQKMACIDITCPTQSLEAVIGDDSFQKQSGHIYVLISKNVRDNLKSVAEHLADASSQVLWVVPFHSYMEEEVPKDMPGIHFIRWEVE